MEIREHWNNNAGSYGWVILAGTVIALDVMLPQTLSSAVDRALEHDYMKYVAWGVGGIVGGHLFNIIPEKVDPIAISANFVARRLGL